MRATSVDKFKQYYSYSPTHSYMVGRQGDWVTNDYKRSGKSVYGRILEDKERLYE